MNYSDPSGNAYQGISSQFNYNEHDHTYGGRRENFYDPSCLGNPPPSYPSMQQIFSLGYTALHSAAAYSVDEVFTWYGYAEMFVSFWEIYDICRFAGLSNFASLSGAGLFAVAPDLLLYVIGDNMGRSTAMGVTTNVALDAYIEYLRPSAEEAARNRTNHIAVKSAAVTVGGCMASIAFGQLEVRDYLAR